MRQDFNQQVSGTVPLSPLGLLAVQVNSVTPPWAIVSLMLVTVNVGFTPVQLGFGHPASWPLTVEGAVSTAGLVVKVTFPFLIALAGTVVGAVTGPTRTLFCPGAVLPPWFSHGQNVEIMRRNHRAALDREFDAAHVDHIGAPRPRKAPGARWPPALQSS